MQMRAVVELAVLGMGLEVRHVAGKVHGLDVVQPELLKPRRVDQCSAPVSVNPVQRGAGGRVFAGVERLRDFGGQHLRMRNQEIGQAAFARARGAEDQRFFALHQRHQRVHRGLARVVGGLGLDRQREHLIAHGAVGRQLGPGAAEGFGQVAFVQGNDGADTGGLGGNQCARQLVFRELRLGRHEDEHLVQIGRKGLGAHLILPVKQVVARLDFFDRAFVFRGQPAHTVAHHGLTFFAARVADDAFAVGFFNQHVATETGHYQTCFGAGDSGPGRSARLA